MAGRSLIEQGYDRIVARTGAAATPFGFERRGAVMRLMGEDSCAIIQFQRSTSNSAGAISFTLNLAIVCGRLLYAASPPLDRTTEIHGHLRQRIGLLLPEARDVWWTLDIATDTDALAAEISALVTSTAIPFLREHLGCENLRALWQSGRAPGLTDSQRAKYLAILQA